jgi:hypothetical protein
MVSKDYGRKQAWHGIKCCTGICLDNRKIMGILRQVNGHWRDLNKESPEYGQESIL